MRRPFGAEKSGDVVVVKFVIFLVLGVVAAMFVARLINSRRPPPDQ